MPGKDAEAVVKDDETGEVLKFRSVGGMYGNFDIILDHFSRPFQLFIAHTRAMCSS